MNARVDAAVPVDAQTATTDTWKTAQTAVSHSAHTHHRLTGPTHKKSDTSNLLPWPRVSVVIILRGLPCLRALARIRYARRTPAPVPP